MTWTKFGDEYPDAAWDLSDAAWRTHGEALMWSNRLGLDLEIPKRHLRRFAFSDQAEDAAAELCATGWWKDTGDYWNVGQRFPEWQIEHAVIEQQRADAALRQRRHRLHKAGAHALCLPRNCPHVTRDETGDVTHDPGRVGSVTGKPCYPPRDKGGRR